jgi:hypothetical protein
MSEKSIGGARYFITFTDDLTRRTCVHFLSKKSEALAAYQQFEKLAVNQCGHSVRRFRSDHGGEFVGKDFLAFLASRGTVNEFSAPYTPEQNGVAERKNRTLSEMARCMLLAAGLPRSFWAEAISLACYISNRLPTTAVPGVTPEEAWSGKKPDLAHLKIFGSRAFAHIPSALRSKLESKAKVCLYLGPSLNSRAHRLFDPSTNRIVTSRDVVFDESKLGLSPAAVSVESDAQEKAVPVPEIPTAPAAEPTAAEPVPEPVPDLITIDDEPDAEIISDDDEPAVPAMPRRQRRAPAFHRDFVPS